MASAALPFWPARLSEDSAAAYLSVSKTTFRERWQACRYPQPARERGRLFWARTQLDRFVEAQFGLAANEDEEGKGWGD